MLLTIDIDNKFTNFGVFDNENLIADFKINTDKNKSSDEVKLLLKLMLNDNNIYFIDINNIIISSVVPELLDIYQKVAMVIIGKNPMLISSGVKTGLNIKCENPKDVGSDRIIRAVGANDFNNDLIIIFAASITTIDFINNKKQFLGGVILPGIDLYAKSLNDQGAKLPQVEILKANNVLGNTTKKSIQNGIYHAYNFAINGIIEKMLIENKLEADKVKIILTGSFADILNIEKYNFEILENLGLYGLQKIFEFNK